MEAVWEREGAGEQRVHGGAKNSVPALYAQNGETALIAACAGGRLEVMHALLDAGADKEAEDSVGGGGHGTVGEGGGGRVNREHDADVDAEVGTLTLCAEWLHASHSGQHAWPTRDGAGPVGCGCLCGCQKQTCGWG